MKILTFLLSALFALPMCATADWQDDLESVFDQVDTFDVYPDWTGDAPDNGCLEHAWGGRWGYHCYYERDESVCPTPRPTVVTDHGSDRVVTGKSVRLSHSGMGGLDCGECSTIRYYAGSGTQSSGYSDVYIFKRIYFPETLFPTWALNDDDHTQRCYDQPNNPDPVVCYVEGKGFCDTDSWKWISVSLGFKDANTWSDQGIVSNECRYGANETQFYIAGGASQNYEKRIVFYAPESMGGSYWGAVDITPYLGTLAGVEFHVRKESTPGGNDGLVEVWFYSQDGTATQVFSLANATFFNTNSSCIQSLDSDIVNNLHLETMNFNRFQIESNKRLVNTLNYNGGHKYTASGAEDGWMESVWYMDDFIVNGTRIGPTYFAMSPIEDVPGSLQPGTGRVMAGTGSFQRRQQ